MLKKRVHSSTGIFYVLATAVISGISIFINKLGVSTIDPFVFAGLKNLTVALVILAVILGLKGRRKITALTVKQWLALVVIGIIGGGLPFLLFFKGLQLTSAAQASFWHKSMFLLAVPLAVLCLREKISQTFLLAALLLVGGNLLLLQKLSLVSGPGDIYVILAAFLWALENTLVRSWLKGSRLSPIIAAWGRMFFGALMIGVFLVITGRASDLAGLTGGQLGWILLTSVFLTGYILTWYRGLQYTPLATATAALLLGGPVTSLLTLLFLPGFISGRELTSLLFTLAGVFILVGWGWIKTLAQKASAYARS